MAILTVSLAFNSVRAATDQAANYNGLTPNEFMTRWSILGPLPIGAGSAEPTPDDQKKAFETDAALGGAVAGERDDRGNAVPVGPHAIGRRGLRPWQNARRQPNAVAYARARVEMPAETRPSWRSAATTP